MGIDLIENSELAALSHNRVAGFVNEYNSFSSPQPEEDDSDDYESNFSDLYEGDDQVKEGYDEWLNTTAKTKYEYAKERRVAEVTWQLIPQFANRCSYLLDKRTEVKNAIKAALASGAADRTLNPMYNFERQVNDLIAKNKCDEDIAEAKLKKEKEEASKDFEDTAKKASMLALQLQAQAPPENKSNLNKYIIIGVGAVVVLTVVAVLLKKS